MPIFLHGLGLRNFRGIGQEWSLMENFSSFNFFIGQNNSGKSTVLDFIHRYIPQANNPKSLSPLDANFASKGQSVQMSIAVPAAKFVAAAEEELKRRNAHGGVVPYISKIADYLSDNGSIWIDAPVPYTGAKSYRKDMDDPALKSVLQHGEWQAVWGRLTQMNGGDMRNWIPESMARLLSAQTLDFPTPRLVPAKREISTSAEFGDYSGKGLIGRLAQAQNPEHNALHDRVLFDRINKFLQNVTGHPEARMEVPHSRAVIQVEMDGKVLPLSSLGTGIQEVIMIASFCTMTTRSIVCVEEPELHLHPLLQRKLISYLGENTDNQYFIATHSASFIDTPGASIFHVKNSNGSTSIEGARLNKRRYEICVDLGSRASDILQSNSIVWVEGPSDRIYLKHWLRAVDPSLQEGVHFSIMFYGGRMLSHLSVNDDEVSEFVALPYINRNMAILIDSDRSGPHARINATKRRILQEFRVAGALSWMADGREVENYVPYEMLQAAVSRTYSGYYLSGVSGGKFDHALHFNRLPPTRGKRAGIKAIEDEVDKVKVAREVVQSAANLSVLDLRPRISELARFIRRANDLDAL